LGSFVYYMLSALMPFFQDKLDDSAFKILTEYQTATVTLLSLLSASTGDVSNICFGLHSLFLVWHIYLCYICPS
jgi:hypothetical protein